MTTKLSDPKTHAQMSLIRVDNEKQLRLYNVDEIAREIDAFDGSSVPRTFPLFLVYYKGRIRGFFQIVEQVCVYPAFGSVDLLDVRDSVRIMRDLVIEAKRQWGNPIFMLCERAEQMGPEHMKLLGVKKAPETAYLYAGEEED